MNLTELSLKIEKIFAQHLSAKRWVVAYSGGVDSTVLLHVVKQVQQNLNVDKIPELVAVHVHHGLNENADAWAIHCQQKAQSLGVKLEVCRVDIKPFLKEGPEAAARMARYQAFAGFYQAGDVFFLGHHLDDQIETFFLRLKRAAGVKGLGAIKVEQQLAINAKNITFVRPLLRLEKAQLLDIAVREKLAWIEDGSNQNEKFDRNFLRQSIIPNLVSRWPNIKTTVLKSISHLQESQQLHNDLAQQDFAHCQCESGWENHALNAQLFFELSVARRKNLLRYVLENKFNYFVSESSLLEVCKSSFSRFDFPESNLSLELFGKKVFFYQRINIDDYEKTVRLPQSQVIHFLNTELSFESEVYSFLDVKVREGGERAHPQQRKHSQQLKKLFQEYNVPPWWRNRVPLLYFENVLVAVGDLWIEQNAAADLKISWQK